MADYLTMAGGAATAAACLDELRAKGRLVEHLGVPHISFPTWTERQSQQLVEPAGAQAGQVERRPPVAGGHDGVDHGLALGQHGVEVELGHLDAGDVAVVADPQLGEARAPAGPPRPARPPPAGRA